MAHQSQPSRIRVPLGDLTNTCQTEGLQKESTSKDRKRQREKERYAAMSMEMKDDRNRKQCERRMMKKALADGNQLGQVHALMEQDNDNKCLQSGQFTEHCQQIAGDEVLTNTDSNVQCINENRIDKSVGDAGGDDDNEWLHRGHLTPNNEKTGGNDDPKSMDDQKLSPSERRRRKDRARYAEMSPGAKEALLKRNRDARASNRLFKMPQEVKESRRQVNFSNRKRRKEQRENNLHPDSIAMENPKWKPELLLPPGDKPPSRVSEHMVIPDFGGTPVYVKANVREPPQQVETPESFLSNTAHTAHLTPGLRESRRKHRNQEFESTIERNTNGTTAENENIAS